MAHDGSKAGGGEWLMRLLWRTPPATLAERTRRRVTVYLIPFLFCLYILAYLDRVNISVAQLDMTRSVEEGGLGLGLDVIGIAAGMFFWGYWILEIPSTVSVVRLGARWVFARILILWGLCAALIGLVGTPFVHQLFAWLPNVTEHSSFIDTLDTAFRFPVMAGAAGFINGLSENPKYQLYFFRFMLGFFEGGFFPSVIVYLSLWFRPEDRAKSIASFMAAIPLSMALGVPVSGLLLSVNWLGLPGWRWIFILQGVAPVIAGIVTLFYLPDRPTKAKWLPADERDWLAAELERERKAKAAHHDRQWVSHLGTVLLLTVVYFCLNLTSYGLTMFMPAIIKSQSGASSRVATFLAALPYLIGMIAMLVNGRHSDRTGERAWHVAVPLALMSAGIWLVALFDGVSILPVLFMLFVVGTFMFAHLPAFWPMPTAFLGATAAASAIGFINMIGNMGGSVGPTIVGKLAAGQTSFAPALMMIAPWPFVGAVLVLVASYTHRRPSETSRA